MNEFEDFIIETTQNEMKLRKKKWGEMKRASLSYGIYKKVTEKLKRSN